MSVPLTYDMIRLNESLYHSWGLHRLTESASPFTLVSFVSLSTKNLKSIKDHGINAKITGWVRYSQREKCTPHYMSRSK